MSLAKSEKAVNKKQELHHHHHQFASDDSGNFTGSMFTEGDGSHVTMLSPRRDPASSVAGLTEDGCHTSAVSLSEYLTAPSTPRNQAGEHGESYLKTIFDNFNELYHDKMAWIDENIPGGDTPAHVMAKKNVLEHWVSDVIEQNNILVQTVEELESEAERKVQNLQKKVQEAAEMAKEHMNMIKEYEEQIKHLIKEKNIVEKQEEFFRKESMYLEKEKRRALDRLHTLETDNASLVVLINRIRDMGVWDINGLEFAPRTYDSIFGLYPSLPGSEVQTVFTREKTRNLEKAESNVAQLMAQVEELHDRKNEAERLLTEKTKITEELQNDIKELHLKIKQYQDEHQEFKKSLKETQEQLKAATLKNSRPSTADVKREAEMKKMLTELKDLRNQLNVACNERQQAMKESNALKMDLKGRITQMEEMKQLLEQLQTESATTRTAVQDVQVKQDQMSCLKDKVSFYEASYENSNVLLEAKSEIIVKLQSQMEQLHDKVTRLEQSRSCSPNPAASKMPHARSLSPTPPARQPSRPASHPPSHPASRANSQPSTNVVPILRVAGTPSPKKVGRKDVVVRKPTVKVRKTTAVPKPSKTAAEARSQHFDLKKHIQSYSNKPPWNDHFVRSKKPPSPRPSSDKGKHYSASKLVTEIKSVGTTKHGKLDLSVSALSNLTVDKLDDKRSFAESKHQSVSGTGEASHPTVNRIIADYLGQPDSGKLSSGTEKTASKRTLERVKLPPIPTKSDTTTSPHPSTKAYEKTIEEQHLPRIIVKEKKSHTSHTIDTLENLMEVCVKASRELNKAPEGDTTSKSTPKYRVIAGHSHRRRNHRSRENTYTVEALPKTKTKSDLPTPSAKTLQEIKKVDEGKPSKGKSATKFKETKDANNNNNNKNNATAKKESESESLSDISQFRRVAVHPQAPKAASHVTVEDKSPDTILAELPKVSLDYLVKKWIVSSPTPSKKMRKPRSSSPDKSKHHHRSKYSSDNRPESRGKSKSSGPVNLKLIAADDWGRKQDQVVHQHQQHHHHHHHQNPETTTHSDATGDRDSGHLSDFSDWWNWNGNDDESMANDKEVQQNDCEIRMMSELSAYESVGLGSPQRDIERIQQILAENQKLREQNSKLEQLNEIIRVDKEASEETHRKELADKDVEITMQKLPSGRGDGPSCGIGVQVVDLEETCANFQCKVVESVKELRRAGGLVGELGEEANRLKKEHLLYRSYTLFTKLEQEQEEYVGERMESKELDKVVPDRILEDVRKLEEAVRILQGHVIAKISAVDDMTVEFGTVKHKMDMLASDFRRAISEAQEENQRLLKVVDKLEKKQAEIDELLVMENDIRSLEDDVSSQDFGVLLTEKRLGVIQQSYDKLSHELIRRDELISQRDSKIAELEAHIRESEAKKTEREGGHNGLGIVLRHPPPSSPCSDAEQIQRLIWLTTSLRRKLKKKKEHEEELKKEKQVVFRLASAISSTWEAVRNAYEQLQAESCQLKKSVCEPGIQSEINQRTHSAYVEEGGGDECGAHRGPAVVPSLPYSNSVSGTSMFYPPDQSQDSYHGSVGIASISSRTLDPENIHIVPVPPSLWSPNDVNKQSAIQTSGEPCVHNPDTCIYMQNVVKALEECHNRIKEEVAAHS